MSEITVRNRVLHPAQVTKLPAGKAADALGAIAKNGADDLLVKVGEDTFQVSGRGMALRGVKPGDAVTLGGKAGKVQHVDRQLNSFGEGMVAWPGLAVAGVGTVWGAVGFIQGVMQGSAFSGLGIMLAGAALVAGLVINLAPAAWGALRKVEY